MAEGRLPLTAPDLTPVFAAAMDRCGPFEPHPALALAVSGGADSMALALLARDWAASRGGSVLALVVDHHLRPGSAQEAILTCRRLANLGIPSRLLTLNSLHRGPALAERARIARYQALTEASIVSGRLHLLLGHHAADQAETVAMRVLRDSFSHGLVGMAALRETPSVRLLRPLLPVQPADLRAFLAHRGIRWIEDPSNQDDRALRSRLRRGMTADPDLSQAAAQAGKARAGDERALAVLLAERVSIHAEGFALLSPGRVRPEALRALLRTIAGAPYPVGPARVAALAAAPIPATLGGARLIAAGRLGPGLLVIREEAAITAPVPARHGVLWDSRFRLLAPALHPEAAIIAPLGDAAAGVRHRSHLPAAVLRTLPALWRDGKVIAIPHLRDDPHIQMMFTPPAQLCGPDFVPAACSEL